MMIRVIVISLVLISNKILFDLIKSIYILMYKIYKRFLETEIMHIELYVSAILLLLFDFRFFLYSICVCVCFKYYYNKYITEK